MTYDPLKMEFQDFLKYILTTTIGGLIAFVAYIWKRRDKQESEAAASINKKIDLVLQGQADMNVEFAKIEMQISGLAEDTNRTRLMLDKIREMHDDQVSQFSDFKAVVNIQLSQLKTDVAILREKTQR